MWEEAATCGSTDNPCHSSAWAPAQRSTAGCLPILPPAPSGTLCANNNKKMGLKTLQQQMTWIKEWKMFSLGLLQTRNTSTDKDAATSVWVSKAGIKLTTIRVLSLFFSSAPVVYTSASLPAPCFDMLNKMYLFTVSQILSWEPCLQCSDFTWSQGFAFKFQAP